MRRISTLAAFTLLLGFLAAPAGAAELVKGPAPLWVKTEAWSPRAQAPQADSDYEDLLREYQANLATRELYFHYAFRFLSPRAVQNDSTIRIDYAPDYQSIRLHTLVLWRDGKPIDQRSISFRSLQRETRLEESMYDGDQTWVGFLKDVRPGDVVEVAFTIQGENPIFAGRYSDSYHVENAYAVDRWALRILAPAGKTPEIRAFHTELEGKKAIVQGMEETTYSANNVGVILNDDNAPPDSQLGGRFILSDWKSWSEVVEWGRPIYSLQASAEVSDLAKRLTEGQTNLDDKALSLLRYVQDKIRYLGIEVGVNSHQPHPALEVLQNGFGDCKDKAILFCSLAQAVGLKAWPVLVDTRAGNFVKANGPTPLAFNHVIAAVATEEGTVFVDPTRDQQGGNLRSLVLGPYLWGLELREGVQELTALPGPTAGRRNLVQTFHFNDFTSPGTVKMEYSFFGSDADDQRWRTQGLDPAKWKKDVGEWLHDQWGETAIVSGPEWVDDRAANTLKLTYSFTVKDYWELKDGHYVAEFYPRLIGQNLYDPENVGTRTQPYGLEFPIDLHQTTRVELPEVWHSAPGKGAVSGPGFKITTSARVVEPKVVEFLDDYTSLADRVEVADWSLYLKKLKEARKAVGWSLTQSVDDKSGKSAKDANPVQKTKAASTVPSSTASSTTSSMVVGAVTVSVLAFFLFAAFQGSDF